MNDIDALPRTANLVAVFAALVGDALAATAPAGADRGVSETAALITIASYPGQTITILARILGLSHSAAVRVVEKLGREGLVAVDRGRDRREVTVVATAAGAAMTAAILARRRARLVTMLGPLDAAETATLAGLMEKIIGAETRSPEQGDRICRFCDLANCPQDRCPVERKACRLRGRGAEP